MTVRTCERTCEKCVHMVGYWNYHNSWIWCDKNGRDMAQVMHFDDTCDNFIPYDQWWV